LNLRNDYKYTGGDKSLIAARMQPFWNWSVKFIPETVAPNMVTLVGLYFIFVSYALSVYYTPLVKGVAPWYIYVIHAVCLFCYQTLDALDGKHARNTGNSSALGELFDHGCDAVSTTMLVLTVCSTVQLGSTPILFYTVLISNLVFFSAQWEQYTAGKLVLGYINVTEAQFSSMTIYLITAAFGPNWWLNTFEFNGYTLRYHHVLIIIQMVLVIFTMLLNIWSVIGIVREKKLSLVKVMSQLIPAIATAVISSLWVHYSPTNVLAKQPQEFLMTIGLLFPNMVGRIVFARMCKADFSWLQYLVFPLLVGLINALTHESICPEKYFVWGLLTLYTAAYAHFALSIIDVLCALLNIKCLTPKPKEKKAS